MDNQPHTPHLDAFFGALADPTRRAVIERLTAGPAAVSDLHAPHDMALPTFMKHLSKLEAAGLVRSEKKGRVRTVHIEAAPLQTAETWLNKQRKLWEGRLDRLERLAAQLEGLDDNDD
ncbi:MAG: metalloregulator ArsR/SmtB family transcription factor [Pseudomonadota bacterium]